MAKIKLASSQKFVKVNFSNRGLRKAVKSVRGLNEQTPNSNSVVEIAGVLQDVVVERDSAVQFPSVPGLVGVDYVGYIVEKERLDKKTGAWVRTDEYRIVGSLSNSFKDSRVAYGNLYRYRIKTVIKVTIGVEKESLENSELVQTVKEYQAGAIKKAAQAQQATIASIDSVTNVGLQHQVSTGQVNTAFQFLEGLKVEASETGTKISQQPVQTSMVSATSAKTNLRLLKNLAVSNVDLAMGNASSSSVQQILQEAEEKTRNVEVEYVSIYYESDASPKWTYVNVVDGVPPPPPTAIEITPNTPDESILVAWLKPSYTKKTITGFRLYRRERIGLNWRLLKEFDLIENFYIDQEVELNKRYVYALTTIDVHGLESLLSAQIEAQLNPRFALERKERPLRWISGSGARLEQTSVVYKRFFENEVPIVVKENIVIGPTEVFRQTSKKYLVRVRSLDIHEKKEFVITLKNENIEPPT